MRETRSVQELKDAIFAGMKELGADYAEASYSGGNDEGGVDDVALYRHVEDERIEVATPTNFGWDSPLFEALNDLLSIEFGTWAGDWSAHGTVFADLRQDRIWRRGEMSSYDPDNEDY